MRQILLFIVIVAISLPRSVHCAFPADTDGIRTHLVGRDGLCLDSGGPSRYNTPTLVPCMDKEERQVWNVHNDGTIRWTNDRCLFPYGKRVLKVYILAKTGMCNELTQEEKTWSINNNLNVIVHVESGLVLTVINYTNTVTVEPYKPNTPLQIWAVQEAPRVVLIMGLHNYKCLWYDPRWVNHLSLHDCTRATGYFQEWALFRDGSIHLDGNRSKCLTSSHSPYPYYFVSVSTCEGKDEERWEVDAEGGAIHHPGSSLVMDVIPMRYEPEAVVLFTRNGASTQQWTLM